MEIRINGKAADITLEREKTLGELLSGLDAWLRGSDFCLSGLEIDGEHITTGAVSTVFDRPLDTMASLDIQTSPRGELTLEALDAAAYHLRAYGGASPEDRGRLREDWEQSAAASYLSDQTPDLYRTMGVVFSGEGLSPGEGLSLLEERIRELTDPLGEVRGMESLVDGTAQRMEDLPLDIQTGKDRRAAETVSLFTTVAEKLIRLFFALRARGGPEAPPESGDPAGGSFPEDLNAALRELVAAYEAKDAVLVGDIVEYELAPRLRTFYSILTEPSA
jgi:hypothetical protein